VGDLHRPVLSAVRFSTADEPAEFIVIVDCGEPHTRPATRHAARGLWPDHSKAEHGQYDLTFDQANRRLAARAGLLPSSTVEVIVEHATPTAATTTPSSLTGRPARRHQPSSPGDYPRSRPGRE
jgi:hypothetical protein